MYFLLFLLAISGTAEVFNLYDTSTYPKHKNVTISLENVSIYPILNVIIFDKYLFQLLKGLLVYKPVPFLL